MGDRILLAVLVLALSGCVSVEVKTLGPGPFARGLEKDGIDGRPVSDARCRSSSDGGSYVCTYFRGPVRKMMAFRVAFGDEIVIRSPELDAPRPIDSPDAAESAEFALRAGTICARRNAALRGLSRAKNRRQALANVDRALAAERAAVLGLATLSPPASLAEDFAKLIDAERKLVNMTAQGRAAMARGDDVTLRRAASIAEANGHVIAYATRRLGLSTCAPS